MEKHGNCLWVGSSIAYGDGQLDSADVFDWDQRRCLRVYSQSEEMLDPWTEDRSKSVGLMASFYDKLGPDALAITINENGELQSISTKPKDDCTMEIQYARYDIMNPAANDETLKRSELIEVDRLSHNVDLVHRKDNNGATKTLIFKYSWTDHYVRNIWDELHMLKQLKGHPLIAVFDRIILDDVEPLILGFTMDYVAGGTLAENRTRLFHFSWLKQLTELVDDLNLKYGLLHQDIAPRNIAIDPVTNTIKLFDFGYSGKLGFLRTGSKGCSWDINAVIFTIYELITLDDQFRRAIPWRDQDVTIVENMTDWPLKADLEEGKGGVAAYRFFLEQWVNDRRTIRVIENHSEASEPIDWPEIPVRSVFSTMPTNLQWPDRLTRPEALSKGRRVVDWERTASIKKYKTFDNQGSINSGHEEKAASAGKNSSATKVPEQPTRSVSEQTICEETDVKKGVPGSQHKY